MPVCKSTIQRETSYFYDSFDKINPSEPIMHKDGIPYVEISRFVVLYYNNRGSEKQ